MYHTHKQQEWAWYITLEVHKYGIVIVTKYKRPGILIGYCLKLPQIHISAYYCYQCTRDLSTTIWNILSSKMRVYSSGYLTRQVKKTDAGENDENE